MFELFDTAISGINIIPTTLLGGVILYWLVVIIGAIDTEFIDIDIDDFDTEGALSSCIGFLNIDKLPLMLVLSVYIFMLWILTMMSHLLSIDGFGIIAIIALIINLIISMAITKFITNILKDKLKGVFKPQEGMKVKGSVCVLLNNIENNILGQGEIKNESGGAPIIINVKAYNSELIKKGEHAEIVKKDEKKNYYIVQKLHFYKKF